MKHSSRIVKTLIPVLILLLAAAMTAVFLTRAGELRKNVNEKKALLLKSRAVWEQTAADKEALLKELTEVRNQIREAELSLDEATEKAAGLKAEINALQEEMKSFSPGN